jgi:murein DD-endopeptidase MepM/ murein hydrolase activator NlpD
MHTGIDFAASIGTPIYATADGTIAEVSVKFSGYGKMVEIDHGFGYRTRYAHMHEFVVRPDKISSEEISSAMLETPVCRQLPTCIMKC